MLYDNLLDILKHTHGLGFIETVKLKGENGETHLEALSQENSVIFFGKLSNSIPELDGHTVGLGRMGILNGYVNFGAFKDNQGSTAINTQSKGTTSIPAEITFTTPEGHNSFYRFMSEAVVNNAVNVPPFKGATWDFDLVPTKKNLKDLQYFSQILGTYEGTFNVTIDNGNMILGVGTQGNDRAVIPFATNINASMPDTFRWPLLEVINVLKLSDTSKSCKMKFSSKGLLCVEITSGLGEYNYYLPART